jgi:uncharacterized protein (TIGR01777 family)
MPQFIASTDLPVKADTAFSYHDRPGALDRLLPPWQNLKIIQRSCGIHVGERVLMKIGTPIGISVSWLAEHTVYDPPKLFVDQTVKGPVAFWRHEHQFSPGNAGHCRLTDSIEYRLPMGWLGQALGGAYFKSELQRMFRYRHQVTRDDLSLQQRWQAQGPLRIAVSGSSGMVGTQLVALLRTAGHTVLPLRRPVGSSTDANRQKASDYLEWSPKSGLTNPEEAEGLDVVIHLAGKGIAEHRWSESVKKEIRDSRVVATQKLASQLAALDSPPKVFVSASAIGLYGNRGDEVLDESSAPGVGFLSEVAKEWERAADPLRSCGKTRVVHPRLGVVLHPRFGAMAKLLTPLRLGLGGPMGSGRQYWSWISIDDCIGAIYHLMMDSRAEGGVNLVAPESLPNKQFVERIARVLWRPAFLPAPAFGLKLLLGEMAGPLLLDSTRCIPTQLTSLGYQFRHPQLSEAVSYLLGL